MNIGDMFFLERHKRRLTLHDVACKIGCSALSVSKIEIGRVLPSKSDILKLSELYGLDGNAIYRLVCEEMEKKQKGAQSPQKQTGSVTCKRSERPLLGRGHVTSLINHG